MKTLKALLKDLLSKSSSLKNETPAKTSACENQSNLSTKNQNQNETEIHESARNPQLDNPSAREDPRSDQGDQKSGNPEGAAGAGSGQPDKPAECSESGPSITSGEGLETDGKSKDIDHISLEEALRDAYKKGEIAGRNARIEEKYFPKTDDGIPCFKGKTMRNNTITDIFSMAREA